MHPWLPSFQARLTASKGTKHVHFLEACAFCNFLGLCSTALRAPERILTSCARMPTTDQVMVRARARAYKLAITHAHHPW